MCGIVYRLKETTIFEISLLKDFFAINSDVDCIKNFQGYQNGLNQISVFIKEEEDQIFKEHPVDQSGLKSQ